MKLAKQILYCPTKAIDLSMGKNVRYPKMVDIVTLIDKKKLKDKAFKRNGDFT